jgi:hypothetical protein
MEQIRKEQDETRKILAARNEALPLRLELAARWEEMNLILLKFVSTTGELGTIANLEQHNIRKNGSLTGYDGLLKTILKRDLPENAFLTKKYKGETRIIATTNQSIIEKGSDFYLKIRILSENKDLSGKVVFRQIGSKEYLTSDLKNIARNVFEARVPATSVQDDFEYHIEVSDGADVIKYPSSGIINNAVIVF